MSAATLTSWVDAALASAFSTLGLPTEFARSVPSGKPDLADRQCNGAMPAAKSLGRNPREVAQAVADALAGRPEFESVSVAGPGFVNLKISGALLAECAAAQASDPGLGIVPSGSPLKVIVDFGGPNVAKPLHVGHLRSLVIGESLRRLLGLAGHDVVSDVHLGDWGLQMGQLISEMELRQPTLPYFDADFEGPYPSEPPVTLAELEEMYPVAAKACKADPTRLEAARKATADLQSGRAGYVALWKHFRNLSLAAQEWDFADLGAHFDLFLGESDVNGAIPGMIADLKGRGLAIESDGALVVEVAEAADGQRPLPPLILLKSDGAVMYGTTDLATIAERLSGLGADRILYVVDQRQADHFKQVFRAAMKTGIAGSADLVHVGFGTVNGKDGKALKTRDGGTVKLADLLDEAVSKAAERIAASGHGTSLPEGEQAALARKIGVAAVKFADLSSNRVSGYVFDADRLVSFEGKTGPYLQYACVRIASILAKAEERGEDIGLPAPRLPAERALALECLRLPEVVSSAAASLLPSEIAEYAFGLAQKFSRFYTDCQVLGEDDPGIRAARLGLCALTHGVLKKALWALGIEVPERM